MKPWLEHLGLGRCPPFHRDPLFLAAIAAGALFWLVLALAVKVPGRVPTWPALVSLLLWQPTVEELLFRGVVQGELLARPFGARKMGPFSAANVIASLAFALIHFRHHPPLWAAAVFAPSLVFGLLRERHGCIWPALVLHIYYNSGYFLLFGA